MIFRLRRSVAAPKPRQPPNLALGDRNDRLVIGSALAAQVETLITGDQEILDLNETPEGYES